MKLADINDIDKISEISKMGQIGLTIAELHPLDCQNGQF